MAEPTQYTFSHLDILRLMVKDQGLTEGYWQLIVNFGFKALNAPAPEGGKLVPALIGTVNHFGIQRVPQPIPGLTIDAATGESVGSFEELMDQAEQKLSQRGAEKADAPG